MSYYNIRLIGYLLFEMFLLFWTSCLICCLVFWAQLLIFLADLVGGRIGYLVLVILCNGCFGLIWVCWSIWHIYGLIKYLKLLFGFFMRLYFCGEVLSGLMKWCKLCIWDYLRNFLSFNFSSHHLNILTSFVTIYFCYGIGLVLHKWFDKWLILDW